MPPRAHAHGGGAVPVGPLRHDLAKPRAAAQARPKWNPRDPRRWRASKPQGLRAAPARRRPDVEDMGACALIVTGSIPLRRVGEASNPGPISLPRWDPDPEHTSRFAVFGEGWVDFVFERPLVQSGPQFFPFPAQAPLGRNSTIFNVIIRFKKCFWAWSKGKHTFVPKPTRSNPIGMSSRIPCWPPKI